VISALLVRLFIGLATVSPDGGGSADTAAERNHEEDGETDLDRLLADLEPVLQPDEFVFVTVPSATELPALAAMNEPEGVSVVLPRADADARSLPYRFVAAWIRLDTHSALDAVGLTAVVSSCLATAGISCNVIAGRFHDHLLVPHGRAVEARTFAIAASVELRF
jgi:hypothetical protein